MELDAVLVLPGEMMLVTIKQTALQQQCTSSDCCFCFGRVHENATNGARTSLLMRAEREYYRIKLYSGDGL